MNNFQTDLYEPYIRLTLGQSGPGSNIHEEVLHILQIYGTGVLSSDVV